MNVQPRWLACAAAVAFTLSSADGALAQKQLSDYVQPAFRDITARPKVVSKNVGELKKMGKGYVDAYTLSRQEFRGKVPGMVRFEGKKGLLTVKRVTNGNRQLMQVPPVHRKVTSLSKEPWKGDSVLDIGLLTADLVKAVESKWLRSENREGKALEVFEVWHPADPKYKHELILDPVTRTVVEHISHHRSVRRAGFKKRLVYREVVQISGVYIPQVAEIYSGENKLAAVMRYEEIKINTGLPDSLFKF